MSELLLRSYTVDDVTVTGRTVVMRCVPYGVVTLVRDRRPDGGLSDPYREGWEHGVFRHVSKAANRVPLIVGDHTRRADPFSDVGRGARFEEKREGLVGEFVLDESPFGEHALAKVTSGQWRNASVGAKGIKFRDDGDIHRGGVRWRTLVHLDHVLLTEKPAFTDAEVLEVRTDNTPRLTGWLDKYPLVGAPSG